MLSPPPSLILKFESLIRIIPKTRVNALSKMTSGKILSLPKVLLSTCKTISIFKKSTHLLSSGGEVIKLFQSSLTGKAICWPADRNVSCLSETGWCHPVFWIFSLSHKIATRPTGPGGPPRAQNLHHSRCLITVTGVRQTQKLTPVEFHGNQGISGSTFHS